MKEENKYFCGYCSKFFKTQQEVIKHNIRNHRRLAIKVFQLKKEAQAKLVNSSLS